jgi:hypothetical protein
LSILPRVTAAQQRNQRSVGGHGSVNLLLKPAVSDTKHGFIPNNLPGAPSGLLSMKRIFRRIPSNAGIADFRIYQVNL